MGKTTDFNFTKRSLEALPTPKTKRVTYHDSQTRGLGLLVQPSGHRSFFWFRKVQGYPTWKTIGAFPDLTVEQARDHVAGLNSSIAKWKASGYEGPSPIKKRHGVPTLGDVLKDYVQRHLKSHAKNPERAEKHTVWQFDHYLARWRDRTLGSISRTDVRLLNREAGENYGNYSANRLVGLIRVLFNWALKEEMWQGDNPARGVTPFREDSRTRFVQHDELPKIFAALSKEKNVDLRDFVPMALFTGARRGDVLSMRWENLDLDRGLWTIPNPKSGESYTVPLVAEVVLLLRARLKRREGTSAYVFPSESKAGHVLDLKRAWKRFLTRAKITDLRVHDLRRTLGSWQAAAGVSLPVIGKSLGHKSLSATEIYARVSLDPVREAITLATRAMITAGKPKKQKMLEAKRG
jgi:integrase